MMCQCISDKDYKPHAGCTLQHPSQNTPMTNVAASRSSSASASQHTSTEAHSSTNILCDSKHQHTETPSVLPASNKSEQIVSSSLNWNTTSQPLEEDKARTPGNIQLITKLHEHDINHTHINSHRCETNSRNEHLKTLTPREVFQHNYLVGWNEWSIHKSNIYDNGKVKDILFHFLVNTRKTKTDKEDEDNKSDGSYSNSPFCGNSSEFNLQTAVVWNTNRIQALLTSEPDSATVETCARLCRVGSIVQHTDAKYYEDLRHDIERLLNDLIRENCEGTLTVYRKEYMHLLQRWLKKYTSLLPEKYQHPVSDVNESRFPLPEDIQENPGCLRSWVEDWESFDLCIPDSGAWVVIEAEKVDLGNTYEIYLSTLKSHIDLTPFDTTVDGEAGWQVIPEDLIANDVITEEQKLIEIERTKRIHFLDPEWMERRRQHILEYFIDKYKYNREKVKHFLRWAEAMKRGESRLIHLCNCS